ncbi:sporulation protein YqfD [Ornithinibacillus scapharcae]|uniref:sporulation protein YqfD n=1 Tax=Ornithinibacillus scapharcae TaxID=1147159 RepID=UPI000225B3A7|nr:sporulation protein YqfD [Ornithinibacillus scapharcae]
MKQIQGSYIKGYVTIIVKGRMPELFFQQCVNNGISVWNVRREGKSSCSGNIKLTDIPQVKQLRREGDYKISFDKRRGYPFLFSRFLRRKEFVLSFIMSVLLILFMSNVIWKIEITGELPKEIEEKIATQLNEYGIHPGAFLFTIDAPGKIQQKLIDDIPELLWVGVHQKGTTYQLEGVEKIVVKKDEVSGPRNLVATKKGVIKKMYVSKGVPKVMVNDFVKPGQLLVSGTLNENTNEQGDTNKQEDEKEKPNPILVAADGEIVASTWYEVDVTIPLKKNYELLTGNQEKRYYIGINNFKLPIWGFASPEYKAIHQDNKETSLNFFKWTLPIKIIESTLSEKQYHELERSREEAIKDGIKQAKEELQLQLGPDAKITSEKVLHESIENGKVKLYLYITVEENIAKAQPINQGD